MAPTDRTWTHDPSHYPEPVSALSGDIWLWAMGLGMQEAARELGASFAGFDTMLHHCWAYESDLEPDWPPDPSRFRQAALEVGVRWEHELRPRSHEITEKLRGLRPDRGDGAAAVADFDYLIELVREQWRIHFLTVIPVHAAREILHDMYVELFGKTDELEPYRLIEGLPNESLDADERLWEVAELARSLDVADVITELPAPAALEQLKSSYHGREVLGELHRYLRDYGCRSRLHELSEPRDAERPELTLESVRLFIERPRDLPRERRERAERRVGLERAMIARIADRTRREAFVAMLDRVKAAVVLEETHAYHIDYPGLAATREGLLGFGRRLVAEGRLNHSPDVFMLRREELRSALDRPWGERLQELAEERSALLEQARSSVPPPYLGPAPDPGVETPPIVAKFYGIPGSASWDGKTLRGTAASAGEATGVARVVSGPADFARVSSGEVMVCATTTPAWTPLFSSIAALVTDTGGILSHAAVVAREYGLPAVVGADAATSVIRDGALVRVNGSTGEVNVLRGPRTQDDPPRGADGPLV
jgi:pyruvate,water dikinase